MPRENGVAVITINRPERRNSLDPDHFKLLRDAWERVRDDPAVRVAIGPLADRIGSKKIFIVLFVLQCIAMLLLFPAGKSYVLLAACAGLIGWNYGAMFTLFPSTLLYYYGPTHQGSNYGVLFTAWGVAGFFGPFIGGKLQVMTGSFFVPFVVAATIVGIAAVILIALKAPEKKHA